MGENDNWGNCNKQEWLDGGMWHNALSMRGRCYTGTEENETWLSLASLDSDEIITGIVLWRTSNSSDNAEGA